MILVLVNYNNLSVTTSPLCLYSICAMQLMKKKKQNCALCCLFGFVLLYNFLSWSKNMLLLSQIETSGPKSPEYNITILLWHWLFRVRYRLERGVCTDKYEIPAFWSITDPFSSGLATPNVLSTLRVHQCKSGFGYRWNLLNNHNLSNYNSLFNWTMRYHRGADIFMPYGELVSKRTNATFITPKKSNCLVCWVVSKYKANQSQVYGQWSKRPLSNKNLLSTISRCYFYLAFENSISTDYIREKLWRNSLQAGSVPVVLGPPRNIYELSIPPVIHSCSIKALATFLSQVADNRERYESYFRWHNYLRKDKAPESRNLLNISVWF
uniref:Fucosyltransferase n=1 Tax=Sinocyclocheilus anshuiensis TaxID=1608454 RepID=A0A671KQP6_9TELE